MEIFSLTLPHSAQQELGLSCELLSCNFGLPADSNSIPLAADFKAAIAALIRALQNLTFQPGFFTVENKGKLSISCKLQLYINIYFIPETDMQTDRHVSKWF